MTTAGSTVLELLARMPSGVALHPAQDVAGGVLWYGVAIEGALVMVNSARQALRADQIPEGLRLCHADPGRHAIARDAATPWLTGETTGSVARTLDDLARYYARHVVLPSPRTAGWLAADPAARQVAGVLRRLHPEVRHSAVTLATVPPQGGVG